MPPTPENRKRLHPEFRSWLIQRMYAMRLQRLDEWADRFEALAGFLSKDDRRCLDIQAISEATGYGDHLLRDTMRRIGEALSLVGRTTDHEGTWYWLKVDPFSAPQRERDRPEDHSESQMERLYRECCDSANDEVRKVISKLNDLRGEVENAAVGALVMDAVVDLSQVSILLTRISATGVQSDRREYIEGLRDRLRSILRGES